ncbi:MAG TPA: hypothetical protein VF553_01770 [Pyrinomonadaceae bacterium]|jgi:hypothetical protein
MAKAFIVIVVHLILIIHANAQDKSDKERDNLLGPVHTVRTETALVTCKLDKCEEGGRVESLNDEYDINGRAVGNRNRFIINDPISRMLNYPFDENIPEIEKPTYREDGTLLYKDVFIFNNRERRSEWISYRADGSIQLRSIHLFNSQGRLTESRSYNASGILASWNVASYDENGNESESLSKKADGSLVHKSVYNYEFDLAGNWIKKKISVLVMKHGESVLEPYAVKYRTITYY